MPDELHLQGREGVSGRVRLNDRKATVHVPEVSRAGAERDLYPLLTVAAAALLGRSGRALVHAAGVVDPVGRGWLLVGSARAGKTTTTVNLIRRGWDFLSDDQIILASSTCPKTGTSLLRAEGWWRPFHLDEGWCHGRADGRRSPFDPLDLGAGRPRREAPLAGLLFPHVVPDEPTVARTLPDAEALCLLLRQTPWLLADRLAAPALLALLQRAARLPTCALRLGWDSYRDPTPLVAALAPILD